MVARRRFDTPGPPPYDNRATALNRVAFMLSSLPKPFSRGLSMSLIRCPLTARLVIGLLPALLLSGCEPTAPTPTGREFRLGEIEELLNLGLVDDYLDTDLSPDGTLMAFYRFVPDTEPTSYTIYLFDLESRVLDEAVTGVFYAERARPRFSPEGGRLVYAENFFFTTPQLRLYHLDEERDSYLAEGLEAAWEPGGERLVLRRDDGLHLLNLDDDGEVHLCEEALVGLEWSPDGLWIYGLYEGQLSRVEAVAGARPVPVSAFEPPLETLEFSLLPGGEVAFCWLGSRPPTFAALVDVETGEVISLKEAFGNRSIAWPALSGRPGDDSSGYLVFQRFEDYNRYYGAPFEYVWTD